MNNVEMIVLLGAFLAGSVIGVGFFGGLWLTVRYGFRSKRPALIFSVSFLCRTMLALAGFYIVGGNQWIRLVACLLGFVSARALVARFLPIRTNRKNQERNRCI